MALTAVLLLGACASPTVVQSVKPGDTGLTCEQLQGEFTEAEQLRADAANEKSVTRGNVVRALFFPPAILGTVRNANAAIAAAEARKVHLANQMTLRSCVAAMPPPPPPPMAAAISTPVVVTPIAKAAAPAYAPKAPAVPDERSKEEKLEELKRLFYLNYISKAAYAEMKQAILDSP
jgi:hypothetical protein